MSYVEAGKKLRLAGAMGRYGLVMGVVGVDFEAQKVGTRLALFQHVVGAVDTDTHDPYTRRWRESLERHLKTFVAQGRGDRPAPSY